MYKVGAFGVVCCVLLVCFFVGVQSVFVGVDVCSGRVLKVVSSERVLGWLKEGKGWLSKFLSWVGPSFTFPLLLLLFVSVFLSQHISFGFKCPIWGRCWCSCFRLPRRVYLQRGQESLAKSLEEAHEQRSDVEATRVAGWWQQCCLDCSCPPGCNRHVASQKVWHHSKCCRWRTHSKWLQGACSLSLGSLYPLSLKCRDTEPAYQPNYCATWCWC